MEKRKELLAGKAKSVYLTDDPEKLILFFRNDTSAFDGEKIEQREEPVFLATGPTLEGRILPERCHVPVHVDSSFPADTLPSVTRSSRTASSWVMRRIACCGTASIIRNKSGLTPISVSVRDTAAARATDSPRLS